MPVKTNEEIKKKLRDIVDSHSYVLVPSIKTFFRVPKQEFLAVLETEPETFKDMDLIIRHGALYMVDSNAFSERELF